MSVFQAKWVVLKIVSKTEKDFLYLTFFENYGKLVVIKKKKAREKALDIGYLINCEISTQEGRNIHSIRNINIVSYFDYKDKPFSEIESFMKLLSFIDKNTVDGNPVFEIFHWLETLLQKGKKLTQEKIILTKLKSQDIFWDLWEKHSNDTVKKILKFIHTHSMKDILKLKGIEEGILEELKKI